MNDRITIEMASAFVDLVKYLGQDVEVVSFISGMYAGNVPTYSARVTVFCQSLDTLIEKFGEPKTKEVVVEHTTYAWEYGDFMIISCRSNK